jgi:hypothetical protein
MATRPLFGNNGFFGNPFASQASVPSVPMPRQGGMGPMPRDPHKGGGLLGNAMGWNGNPIYDGWRRLADSGILEDIGYGMLTTTNMGDAFAAAGLRSAEMRPYREQRQQEKEMRERYAQLFREWGPEYEEFAYGLETGAFDPADAFSSALQYRQSLEQQGVDQQRLAGNAQFLPEGPWRDAYMGGAIDFMEAHSWSQGGGEPDITDTQANLSWRAQEAGLVPGSPEYQNFMLTGGSGNGGMSLSVDPTTGAINFSQGGGGRLNQTIDSGLGGQYVQIQQDALSAVTGLQTLDAMEEAMADPSFYSGFGSEQLMGLKQAAAAIGIDPEGVTSMESFRALSNKAVLDAMGGSLGTGVSNADRSFVEAQVAQLGNTPEGNRQIISIQRALKERQIQIAEIADRYRAANGNMNGFASYLAQWAEANPLFQQAGGNAADPLGLFGG